MGQKALIIVNPAARRLPPRSRLEAAVDTLGARGWSVDVAHTQHPGHATELAQQASAGGYDVAIACGGDGTINEVVNGLAGSRTALAVIPGGTANVWAGEIGVPRDPVAAVRAVLAGTTRHVDLGRVNGRSFLLMVGIGFDGQAIRALSPALKRRLGAAAYVLAGVKEGLTFRGQPVLLDMDGEQLVVNLLLLVVGNTRNYGGVVNLTPRAYADDGLLDVCLFEGSTLRHMLLHLARGLTGRHVGAPRVTYRRVSRLEVSSDTRLWSQVDGELFAPTPLLIEVTPRALPVKVPAGRQPAILTA